MSGLITFFVILLLIIMLGIYYWITSYNVETTINKNDVSFKTDHDAKFCVLSNYSNDKVEMRIVNVISNKNELYVYSNNNSHHTKQLNDNNYVSLLMYTKTGNINKQVLVYGYLDRFKSLDDLTLYKVHILNRKISVTYDEGEYQITSLLYNNKDPKEIKTSYRELSELVKSVRSDIQS